VNRQTAGPPTVALPGPVVAARRETVVAQGV